MLALIPILTSIFLIVLDGTLMNVVMRDVAVDLGISILKIQDLIVLYSLITGALVLIGGKLSDIIGRKCLFIAGATLFLIGSFLAATSKTYNHLLLGWSILEGIGAALMMPASSALILEIFDKKQLKLAYALWGATASVAASFGPLIGGTIATYYSWRTAFLLQVFVGIILVITSYLFIKTSEKLDAKALINTLKGFDFKGAFLSFIGLLTLIYGLLKTRDWGWVVAKQANHAIWGVSPALILITVGIALLTAFVLIEKRTQNALISINTLINPKLLVWLFILLAINSLQGGVFFVFPIILQIGLRLSAIKTGLYFMPFTISVLIASMISSKIHLEDAKIILLGILVLLIGDAYFAVNQNAFIDSNLLFIGFLIMGFGMGLIMARLTHAIMTSVAPKAAGEVSGINSALRRVAASFGTALFGSLFFNRLSSITPIKAMAGTHSGTKLPKVVQNAILNALAHSGQYTFKWAVLWILILLFALGFYIYKYNGYSKAKQ